MVANIIIELQGGEKIDKNDIYFLINMVMGIISIILSLMGD